MNKNLEISTFPAADPVEAFRRAAGKTHHTTIDAIWGYTQFLVDEETSRVLTVCAKSGLYQVLRMPFGPAPAPPEMQSYVARVFGELRDPKRSSLSMYVIATVFCSIFHFSVSLHVPFSQFLLKRESYSKEYLLFTLITK